MSSEFSPFIISLLRESGGIIKSKYGTFVQSMKKDDPSQIVTEVDIASERLIISKITDSYPHHSIVAEESGYVDKKSDYTWIIDPIDGTSNFAQGLPWFGVMVALLHNGEPVASGIYLPVLDQLYSAETGRGAFYNGKKFTVFTGNTLRESLVSFCFDPTGDADQNRMITAVFSKLIGQVRNLRSTNSAVDYAYATDGRLGGAVNFKNRIWDVAAISLIAKEAGCSVTDHTGKTLDLSVNPGVTEKIYTLVAGAPEIHAQLIKIIKGAASSS